MNLYIVTIPVPDYEGEGIFEQPYYFESQKFPSWDKIKEEIQKLHERDLQFEGYTWTHQRALDSLKLAEHLPCLYSNLVQTSEIINHPLGHAAICVRKIVPIHIEEE